MKEYYKRFNIGINVENARNIFTNKINNILINARIFHSDTFGIDSLRYEICNNIGMEYKNYHTIGDYLKDIKFERYLFLIQCIIDILYSKKEMPELYQTLVYVLKNAILNSPIDLGIRIREYKKRCAQIFPCGSKKLDKELVDDVLGVLSENDKLPIRQSFEKGLKEFLEARRDKSKLKNTARDMQLSCDETVKYLFKDKNLGLRHLFKDNKWKTLGLNEYQKQILWNFNEYLDKEFKHKSNAEIFMEDVENIIYLTGMFIRLVILKKESI